MRVEVVKVLSDNYAYLIIDDETKEAAAVDPAEAHVVLARARSEGVRLVSVLTTHHHHDHAGGNPQMAKAVPGIHVYGGRLDRVSACTHPLEHGDTLTIGKIQVQALHTPGHTRGSISYYCTCADSESQDVEEQAESPKRARVARTPGAVFTGDTLFVGGCGRIFECGPQDLHNSLVNVLGRLPEETQVYVGHEYTVKNLQFATSVESENETLKNMLEWAQQQRVARKFTVPSTLKNEWLINPFMRSGSSELASVCPGCSPVEVFTKLRRQKDRF